MNVACTFSVAELSLVICFNVGSSNADFWFVSSDIDSHTLLISFSFLDFVLC